MATLVEMTHTTLPGVEKTVNILAYRGIYYANGWRSLDDPDFTGEEDDPEPPSIGAHAAADFAGSGGVHGRIEHSWTRDGWAPFDVVPATVDGAQVFTPSVANGRGRVTSAVGSAASNHRIWYLHPDTDWSRARITATWWGPSVWTEVPNRPQMGFIFGAREVNDHWVALVCWYNIFFAADPSGLLVNGWDVDGTDVILGNEGGTPVGVGTLANVNRAGIVVKASHVSFINELSVMRVTPPWAAIIPTGTPIVVADMEDPDYDIASGTVASSATADINVTAILPGGAPTSPVDNIAGGLMTPAVPFNATPYNVSAERISDTQVRVTQWAYGSPPPDQGDPRSLTATCTQGSMTAFPTGAGLHGLLVGHAHSGSYAEYGDVTFEQR
jgi:hypothetical protein